MPTHGTASAHVQRAIELLEGAADGVGDAEITPSEIAGVVRDAIESDSSLPAPVVKFLHEALDAISDGMPADYVETHLYAALGVLARGEGGTRLTGFDA